MACAGLSKALAVANFSSQAHTSPGRLISLRTRTKPSVIEQAYDKEHRLIDAVRHFYERNKSCDRPLIDLCRPGGLFEMWTTYTNVGSESPSGFITFRRWDGSEVAWPFGRRQVGR